MKRLQARIFKMKMPMEEPNLNTLIDMWLLGKISPENKAYLEHLMASDPEVAKKVRESKEAFMVIVAERNRLFREKLRKIDEDETKRSGFLPKRMIPLIIFILILGLCWFWISRFLGSPAIAQRIFEPVHLTQVKDAHSSDYDQKRHMADEAFMNKEFEKSIQLYLICAQVHEESIDAEVQWNILLAQFALNSNTPEWTVSVLSFAKEAPYPLNLKAHKLLHLLDSGLYRIFSNGFRPDLTLIKPRLI